MAPLREPWRRLSYHWTSGVRWTGWGFVVFVTSSLALIAWGFLDEKAQGIGVQNIALFAINCVGVWRYLLSRRRKEEG